MYARCRGPMTTLSGSPSPSSRAHSDRVGWHIAVRVVPNAAEVSHDAHRHRPAVARARARRARGVPAKRRGREVLREPRLREGRRAPLHDLSGRPLPRSRAHELLAGRAEGVEVKRRDVLKSTAAAVATVVVIAPRA